MSTYDAKPESPEGIAEGPAQPSINIERWQAESKIFTVDAREPLNVLLKLYNYPAWKVDINGKATMVRGRPKTGQIVIPVSSGESVISVTLACTWDRIVGIVISLLAAAAVLAFALRQTRRELLPL